MCVCIYIDICTHHINCGIRPGQGYNKYTRVAQCMCRVIVSLSPDISWLNRTILYVFNITKFHRYM